MDNRYVKVRTTCMLMRQGVHKHSNLNSSNTVILLKREEKERSLSCWDSLSACRLLQCETFYVCNDAKKFHCLANVD